MTQTIAMRIGGQAVPAVGGGTFRSFEPATRAHLADVAAGGEPDARRAVAAARRAFDEGPWPRMTPAERAQLLAKMGDRILAEADTLAELEARDNGSTIRKATGVDVPGAAAAFAWSAHWAATLPEEEAACRGATSPRLAWSPLGVVASIIPWNLPLLLAAWRIAPPLAAGNTVVVKPASFASLTTVRLVEILDECGLPPGAVNVVTGRGAVIGAALVRSPGVDMVAFTGSDEVGVTVRDAASEFGTTARLDLAGKSPNVVLADADLERAATGVAWGMFLHNGQICMAGSRAVVHRDIHDAFLEKLVERTERLKLGDPLDTGTDLGPLVNRNQARTARRFAQVGVAEGARLVCGGGRPDDGELGLGRDGEVLDGAAYCRPTVLADVRPDDTVAQDEIFGPVLSVIRADSDEDAVRIANHSRYQLSAGVWSADREHAARVARRLKADQVWLDDYRLIDLSVPDAGQALSPLWSRLTNDLDGYRRRQLVTPAPEDPAAATPFALLGLR